MALVDCTVKPIINPNAAPGIVIRHSYHPRRVSVKIIMSSAADLAQMQNEISQVMVPGSYRISFNCKNAPDEVRNNLAFKSAVIKALIHDSPSVSAPVGGGGAASAGLGELANLVVGHIGHYGGAPNFTTLVTDKQRRKVTNYIRATVGRNNLTDDQCLEIARAVAQRLP